MIVIFGKGKVGNGISHLLRLLNLEHVLMDDTDFDRQVLDQADTILVSPGVKQSHDIYSQYGPKIKSELNFLGSILPSLGLSTNTTWIGITATNGKSTSTWLTYTILKNLFPNKNVWIGGNFDIPVSEILANIIEEGRLHEDHIFVIECSSFMLYGLNTFMFDYSIFLNIARDHLDRHRDWEEYVESKFNLLKSTQTLCVTSQQLYNQLDSITQARARVFVPIFDLSKTQFLGAHNQENFAAVTLLVNSYLEYQHIVVDALDMEHIIKNIPPLDHRLKALRKINGITFYDDGICTSSQALNAALDAFYQPLVLMAGGYDKGDDYEWLRQAFISTVGYAVLFGQTAEKFRLVCEKANVPYIVVDNLHDAVQKSYEYAKQHHIEIVLFSPGAASFDMFTNVYDRVGQFVHEVSILE